MTERPTFNRRALSLSPLPINTCHHRLVFVLKGNTSNK